MIKQCKILLIITFLLAFILSIAQENNQTIITKRTLSVEDGMAAREVFCTVQDNDGFMWFGTSNGLNRYDGKAFKLFNTTNTGLSSNLIFQLAIDGQNNLIIIYRASETDIKEGIDKTIQVLDLKTFKLRSLTNVYKNAPINLNKVYWIANDETNELNFLTNEPYAWWKYTAAKGFVKQYEFEGLTAAEKLSSLQLVEFGMKCAFSNKKAAIVLGNYQGYFVFKDSAKKYPKYKPSAKHEFAQKPSYKFYELFNSNKHFAECNNSTSQKEYVATNNEVSDFINVPTVNEESYLCFNEKRGIDLFHNNEIQQLYSASELNNFTDCILYKNYVDRLGNRWICTSLGVFEVTVKQNRFTHYFENSKRDLSSNCNQTRGLYITDGKTEPIVYANVWGDIIVHQDNKDALKKGKEKAGMSYAMLHDQESMFIGGYHLVKYRIASGTFTILDTIEDGETWSLYKFSDSIILSGRQTGIFSYNTHTSKTDKLLYLITNLPTPKSVYKIMWSETKGMIAIAENGIYCIDNQLRIVDYYGKETNDSSHYLPVQAIYDLFEDKQGVCWIASGGGGLYKWKWKSSVNTDNKSLQQFSLIDGLPSPILYRIEQDEQGYLWMGTYNGLARFDPINNTSMVFTTKDGLTSNEFNRISSYKASNGWLYFGSMNGVNAFNPKTMNNEIASLEIPFRLINLTKFSAANNQLQDCLNEYYLTHEMVLGVGDKFISVDFSLLDYQQRIHNYAYRIVGFDKEWSYLEDGSLRISGLPAGKYSLLIKAKLENGQWSKNEIIIPITVLRVFYLQWWFIATSILLAFLLFVLIFNYRTRKLIADKLLLENTVKERTKELQNNANDLQKALGDKELLLAEIHHRVKNNLQIISGLLDLQAANIEDENVKNAFNEGQSRINSISLIHQNLYQHDTLENICFHVFIKELVGKVAELFEQVNQFITFDIGEEEILLDINRAVPLGLIVNELVTNAYKYLPKNVDNNIVSIYLKKEKNDDYILRYKDNGPGLKDHIDLDTPKTLGLDLIKGLAEQLGGKLVYLYEEGSCFVIYFKAK